MLEIIEECVSLIKKELAEEANQNPRGLNAHSLPASLHIESMAHSMKGLVNTEV